MEGGEEYPTLAPPDWSEHLNTFTSSVGSCFNFLPSNLEHTLAYSKKKSIHLTQCNVTQHRTDFSRI